MTASRPNPSQSGGCGRTDGRFCDRVREGAGSRDGLVDNRWDMRNMKAAWKNGRSNPEVDVALYLLGQMD